MIASQTSTLFAKYVAHEFNALIFPTDVSDITGIDCSDKDDRIERLEKLVAEFQARISLVPNPRTCFHVNNMNWP